MMPRPRQRRAHLWAWIYLVLFGPDDEGMTTADDERSDSSRREE